MVNKLVKDFSTAIIDRFLKEDEPHLSVVLPLGDVNLHRFFGMIVILSYREGVPTPTGVDCFTTDNMDGFARKLQSLLSEFWSSASSPIVKTTDLYSFSRSLSALLSSLYEPALRQLYVDKVTKAGLDLSDEALLHDRRSEFAGVYLNDGSLYVSLDADSDSDEVLDVKVSDITPDIFDVLVDILERK